MKQQHTLKRPRQGNQQAQQSFTRTRRIQPHQQDEQQKLQQPEIRVRFYDNDVQKFLGTQIQFPEMECILVDDNIPNPLIRQDFIGRNEINGRTPLPPDLQDRYFERYRQSLDPTDPDGRPLAYLADRPVIHGMTRESYMPGNGITREQMDDLIRWCREYRTATKIVFFDWDRTLTVLEGMAPLKNHPQIRPPLPDRVVSAYLHYIFGGRRRFQELQRLFEFLHRMRVHVFVLTNNSSALDMPEAFLETAGLLDPLLTGDHIYCSADTASTAQKSNKAVVLQAKKDIWYVRSDTDRDVPDPPIDDQQRYP